MDCVRELFIRSPRKSIRRLSAESNIYRASIQRILRDDLHLFPHKIQSQPELTLEQKARRLEFSQWFLGKLKTDEHFIKKIHTPDECHVHLSGLVSKQNFRYRGVDNSGNEFVNESPRSVLKITAWVAIGWDGIHTFLKMMMTEQLQLTRSTIDKRLKSSTYQNHAENFEDEITGSK